MQRIGRCHRYGQRPDVVVVNFVDQSNEADRSDRQRRFHEETLAAEQERERLMQQVKVALEVTPTTARLFAFRWALT